MIVKISNISPHKVGSGVFDILQVQHDRTPEFKCPFSETLNLGFCVGYHTDGV